jgi:uncharacterized protein
MKRLLISALFVSMILFGALASAQDITGDWQGPLTTPQGELRLVVHVTKAADGTLKATMDSPDQAMAGAPLNTFTLEGSKVHFTLNVAKGVFDGALKSNGTISGNWTQGTGGQKMPLVLTKTTTPIKTTHDPAPPSDIDGTWEGSFDSPANGKVHVTFHIKNTADGLTATAEIPEQNIKGWPATAVTRKGSSVKLAMAQVGGGFDGKVNKSLDTMSGDWTQGEEHPPLVLKKAKDDSASNAPKTDAQKK